MMITKSPVQKLRPWMYAVLVLNAEHRPPRFKQQNGVPETKLAGARFKNDFVVAVYSSQLSCDILCAIRAIIVDDNHLPGKVTTYFHKIYMSYRRRCLTRRRTFR